MDLVAGSVVEVHGQHQPSHGLEPAHKAKYLRFFQGRFERVWRGTATARHDLSASLCDGTRRYSVAPPSTW
jgi:hypothetical protein